MKQIILVSSQPRSLVKILNGDASILVLKHALKEGDEVHIYCTKHNHYKNSLYLSDNNVYEVDYYIPSDDGFILNGKVVAKFVVGKVERIDTHPLDYREQFPMSIVMSKLDKFNTILKKACLTADQLDKYSGYNKFKEKPVYALSITQLEIFDKPRELGEYTKRIFGRFPFGWGTAYTSKQVSIAKAHQSWQKAWVEDKI